MKSVVLIDALDGAAGCHLRQREAEALAVRDACLGWLPLGGLLARLADPIVRTWMRRAGTAYAAEIDSVARTLKKSGIWLDVPKHVAQQRVTNRKGDASDATASVVERQFGYGLGAIDWERR